MQRLVALCKVRILIVAMFAYLVDKVWVTQGIKPGSIAMSHHLGRWRLQDDAGVNPGMSNLAQLDEDGEGGHRLNILKGGGPWKTFDPESYEVATADRLAERILNEDVIVIDVRNESEWTEDRLPGATHIMLGYLPERAEEIINSKPIVVHCRTGARSAIGASILKAAGAREVINMQGGLRDWAAAGLPVAN